MLKSKFLSFQKLVDVSNNKPKHNYKLTQPAHPSTNIIFLISSNLGLVSSGILCNYEWQLVATVSLKIVELLRQTSTAPH